MQTKNLPYEFLVHRPGPRRPGDQWRRVAVEVEGVEHSEDAFVKALVLALRLPWIEGEGE